MGEQEKGFDLEVPVVASRREFFEQEAVVSGPPDELRADLEPAEVTERLKDMREAATRRTEIAARKGQFSDRPGPGPYQE